MSLTVGLAASSLDIKKIKSDDNGIQRKRANEGINERKDTLIKKAYELGEFNGVDVALIICKHGRYTTYNSKDHKSWPPPVANIRNTYPLPKIMLPEDVATHLSKCKRRKSSRKDERGEKIMDSR